MACYPKHLIPKIFLLHRHAYVRSILRNSRVLDLGCNRYKILPSAIGLDNNPHVHPDYVGSCLDLPFEDESFDSVTALELIEHFNEGEQDDLLEQVYRVLVKHGQFIISTPNISRYTKRLHDSLWYVSHFVYAREDLGKHIGELTHQQLKEKLEDHDFKILSEKAFALVNYVVECEKT